MFSQQFFQCNIFSFFIDIYKKKLKKLFYRTVLFYWFVKRQNLKKEVL